MTGPVENADLARRARFVGLVIAGTIVLWMAAQWVGGRLGLAPALALVLDFIALAILVWALVATNRIRKDRKVAKD
ncbi:MAG: DUF5337 domain-containing protein [Qingshengfaniella sp.]